MEVRARWRGWIKAALRDALNVAAYCWCCSFPVCSSFELPGASDDRADRCALEAERGIDALERYLATK